ncbi:MAG TPA: hypothetical protein VGD08_17010 [Stellaceae bacterium]|jgi:hypothetical protein
MTGDVAGLKRTQGEARGPAAAAASVSATAFLLCLAYAAAAQAQEFKFDGFAEARLVHPTGEQSWLKGGFGKLRYGGGGDVDPQIGGVVLVPRIELTPEILAVATARYDSGQDPRFGVTEAFVRYRPVSTTAFRYTVKAGAFFPPVSVENEGLGWTSLWTLTNSAINSWIGEEVRPVGGEGRVEYRTGGALGTVEAIGSVFAANDTAGTLLGERGWSLTDRITPLGGHVREPDLFAGGNPPANSRVFDEIDSTPGYYVGASWDVPDYGKTTLIYYNNKADIGANPTTSAWHTRFWSAGYSGEFGDFVVMAQGMLGDTRVGHVVFDTETKFYAAYALVGWNITDEWRLAARIDQFGTSGFNPADGINRSEHGHALTVDLGWRPKPWLRLSGEVLAIDSFRALRASGGVNPKTVDTQLQLSARLFF